MTVGCQREKYTQLKIRALMHFYDRRFKPSPFGIAKNKKAVIRLLKLTFMILLLVNATAHKVV